MKHIFVYLSLSLGLSVWFFFFFFSVCREEDVSCFETLLFKCCWNLSRLLGASTRKFRVDLFTVTALRFLAGACLQYSLMLVLWGVPKQSFTLFSAALSVSLLRISVWTGRHFSHPTYTVDISNKVFTPTRYGPEVPTGPWCVFSGRLNQQVVYLYTVNSFQRTPGSLTQSSLHLHTCSCVTQLCSVATQTEIYDRISKNSGVTEGNDNKIVSKTTWSAPFSTTVGQEVQGAGMALAFCTLETGGWNWCNSLAVSRFPVFGHLWNKWVWQS